MNKEFSGLEIAVIGMAARFPGAQNIEEFWNNLIHGVESISYFSDEELIEIGIELDQLKNPLFVRTCGGFIDGKDCFDSDFFEYTPRESDAMTPHMRIFHECTWEALEDAGYDPDAYNGLIGLYAGASSSAYWEAICSLSGKTDHIGEVDVITLCNKDQLSCRISYKLNLKGPSFTFNTKCSTSLIAIHLAAQGILSGECDMAIAGAICLNYNRKGGYIFQKGNILSPDGHLRTFDNRSEGLIWSEGIGIVVLKSLEEALHDGDHIYAVIKGSATNNDGNRKVGYTAPSVESQVELIRAAHYAADINPKSIGYVELHGSGTVMGDPIEFKALRKAFNTDKKNFCRLGSVKSNLGHMVEAAGVGAFIKTVLILKHKIIPPSLHFESANPEIDLENSPFIVNRKNYEWRNVDSPLRAGVSSFGIGGSNAHIILEEIQQPKEPSIEREWNLILLTARSEKALERLTGNFVKYLSDKDSLNFTDVAYTLQVGRKSFEYKKMLVCQNASEAIELLSSPISEKIHEFHGNNDDHTVVFVFSGLGSQYIKMGYDLYQKESLFRREMDHCFEIINSMLRYDIKEILYPISEEDITISKNIPEQNLSTESFPTDQMDINQTEIAQIIIFIFEYSLAKFLISLGIKPDAMIGYSFGEYVAACIAGVFSLESALTLIVFRAQLIQSLPPGVMLSVPQSNKQILPLLNENISIAIDNESSCIVAGPANDINRLETKLKKMRVITMRLPNSHALHSPMMEPILDEFTEKMRKISLKKPEIPFISNVTGTWIDNENAIDPIYWRRHLRNTNKFADGLKVLLEENKCIFVELGPGRDISTIISRFIQKEQEHHVLNLVKPFGKDQSDIYYFYNKMGQIWLYGQKLDWMALYKNEIRYRLSLPKYPFEKQTFWFGDDASKFTSESLKNITTSRRRTDMQDWFYIQSWKRSKTIKFSQRITVDQTSWLLFINDSRIGKLIGNGLENKGCNVIYVNCAQKYKQIDRNNYSINPQAEHFNQLFKKLKDEKTLPDKILHLWSLSEGDHIDLSIESIEKYHKQGFYSLINLAKTLETLNIRHKLEILTLTNQMYDVLGGERIHPGNSTALGAVKVIPQEFPHIKCKSIDIKLPSPGSIDEKSLLEQLFTESMLESSEDVVAFRNNYRWVQTFEPYKPNNPYENSSKIREKGVYMITGGLSGIGLILAENLAKKFCAQLILIGRSYFPPQKNWIQWLENHEEENLVSQKIKRLQEFEALEAKVLVYTADVSNQEQMERVIADVLQKLGAINGVIHSAGIPDGALILRQNREMSEEIFTPKIKGTLVLNNVLKEIKLDFFVLCSSLTAILGGIGQASYCAANNFLDAFSYWKNHKDNTSTISINWDSWKNVGMTLIAEELQKKMTGQELEGGIHADEGVNAFFQILSDIQPQMAVSSIDLSALLEEYRKAGEISLTETSENISLSKEVMPRPKLNNDFIKPQSNLEKDIASIWERLFGYEKIGVSDDFLELGGDSLKAITVISRVNQAFNTDVPISEFFKNPTIKFISNFISNSESIIHSPVKSVEKKEYYILSSAQNRLYILQQLNKESTNYNETLVFHLDGNLELGKLELAFKKLIKRHECLRMTIQFIKESPVQLIIPKSNLSIELIETKPEEIGKILKGIVKPFDLEKGPLFRVQLIRTSKEKHILIIDIHHIIIDGISSQIFIKDLLMLYDGKYIPPLQLQYKDYAQWQMSQKKMDKVKIQADYWVKIFEGDIPVLHLPTDFSRPLMKSFLGDRVHFSLETKQTQALRELALKKEVTVFMILMAAYTIFLAKMSGQEDIVIGTPIAGRNHADLIHMMGLFVNTLALRNFPSHQKTFSSFLKEIKENTLKAFENENFQFEDLIDLLDVPRNMSRNPLFDTLFNLQNFESDNNKISNLEISGLKLKPYEFQNRTSKFDLTLNAFETDHCFLFTFEYCSGLFKAQTIECFVNYLLNLISEILDDPEKKISDINILTEEEKILLLTELNGKFEEYPQDQTVDALFTKQTEKIPDHIAIDGSNIVHSDEMSISFRNLNERCSQLAKELCERGAQANEIIGLLTNRTIEMVIGLIGILKSGAAYLPIGPEYPSERICHILDHSGASILVVTNLPLTFDSKENSLDIINLSEAIDPTINDWDAPTYLPNFSNSSNDLIYMIYTSGTTGVPKGVMIENRSMVNFIKGITDVIPFESRDRILSLTTLSFDIFGLEVLLPLVMGSRIVMGNEKEQLDAGLAAKIITREQISILQLTPSRLQLFLSFPDAAESLMGIKHLIVGGEAFPLLLLEKTRNITKGKIYNVYGPTETTIWSTIKEVTHDDKITIGKPLANTHIYIVDRSIHLQPVGIAGELCISGHGLARGYFRDEQLTAEKFISNPFKNSFGNLINNKFYDLIYRTGDLGRWLTDGNIEFLGRLDHQIKLRGFRIELGEIESQLLKIDGIKEAIVILYEKHQDKHLCAYIGVEKDAISLDSQKIKDLLGQWLPPYMIPAFFVKLGQIPLTPNGKINRKILPTPFIEKDNHYIAPKNDLENKIVDIWSNVLRIESNKISTGASFFALGGNSLQATVMILKLHQNLNIKLPLFEVFKTPTIIGITKLISVKNWIKNQSKDITDMNQHEREEFVI